MATVNELKALSQEILGFNVPPSTLTSWVRKGLVKAKTDEHGRRDYDLESFKAAIMRKEYREKARPRPVQEEPKPRHNPTKGKPKEYVGKTCGQLLITGVVPKNEYKTPYPGTLMYCDCLHCGRKNIQVRFPYISGNGNYTQFSCGLCDDNYRERKHFLKTSLRGKEMTEEYLASFSDFKKFLFIHKSLSYTTAARELPIEEYKEMLQHFYNDTQFNKVYSFWKERESLTKGTFYDWAKPSLDHIIPRTRGGKDVLENFQYLTVFENLAKRDMTQQEWDEFKKATNTTSDFFIESILKEEENE